MTRHYARILDSSILRGLWGSLRAQRGDKKTSRWTVAHQSAKGDKSPLDTRRNQHRPPKTIAPQNADEKRTHLNRELIEFPTGVESRTQAIQHRLDIAGITRKIGRSQVCAIRVLLSGSPDAMKRIEQTGQLDAWRRDNLD